VGYSFWCAEDRELHDGDTETDCPYFSCNFSRMRELVGEMRAQAMLRPESDLELSHEPEDIEAALAVASEDPVTIYDDNGRDSWRRWLHFLRAAKERGGIVVT
jgi:hypothetical protein